MAEKRIETVEMRAGDIKTGFGNPRKISMKKKEELRRSLETFGDFGSFIIDEEDNVIAGNMRLSVIKEMDPDTVILCKRLHGYTQAELRAINIKDNTHSGEWDLDLLADWTSDLVIDLGLNKQIEEEIEERTIPEMELIHYEKYDYVMIICRSILDYNDLVRALGIEGKKVSISKRKINARAIWYDKMDSVLVPKEKYEEMKRNYHGTGDDSDDHLEGGSDDVKQ